MANIKLDELEHAATIVDDGEGGARALVSRETGMIHMLNDDYMDEEAPVPADGGADSAYVRVPPASSLGIGDELVLRYAAAHLPADVAAVQDFYREQDVEGFYKLLEERGAKDDWQRFRLDHTRAVLARWCEEHGLRLEG